MSGAWQVTVRLSEGPDGEPGPFTYTIEAETEGTADKLIELFRLRGYNGPIEKHQGGHG